MENECILESDTDMRRTFIEQAYQIWKTVRLSESEVKNLSKLHNDLGVICTEIWPGCQNEIFGSIATGLAFGNSDIDYFIKLPENCEDDPYTCIIKFNCYLAYQTDIFEYVSCVPHTRIPVITLLHLATQRTCDITFNGLVAIETSKLIKYLLSLDSRALKLAVLIKYWFKICKLTNTKQLSNHTVTLLVIFFLQLKKILPPVVALQKNVAIDMTEQWNTAFAYLKYESHNSDSLYKLLGDFFLYYNNFNFKDLVVCPYLGYPVKKFFFINLTHIPTEFTLYKKRRFLHSCEMIELNRPICVQDPFQHNRNCAATVPEELACRITMCFEIASTCYKFNSRNEFLRKLISIARILPPLRSPSIYEPEQFVLTDGQLPQKKRSWLFYFSVIFCLVMLITFYLSLRV